MVVKCPYDDKIACGEKDCQECSVAIKAVEEANRALGSEAEEKIRQDQKIASGMKEYWIHRADGAE